MHTCIHAYMHTCIHAYMHTCIHAYMHACIHTYTHTHIHPYTHTYIYIILAVSSLACWHSALACQHSRAQHSLQCIFPGVHPSRYVYSILIQIVDAFIGIGKMHWSDDKHEISWDTHHIHESRTSTSKWRWFFQHPERNYPFGGNGETPDAFLGSAKCIRTSGRYSHVTGCFSHRKVNAPRYE